MKQFLLNFVAWWADFFDSVARARAASELARHGYHEAANRLINGDPIVE
jgi:hypothetical protein